jgi:hypothetical protein
MFSVGSTGLYLSQNISDDWRSGLPGSGLPRGCCHKKYLLVVQVSAMSKSITHLTFIWFVSTPVTTFPHDSQWTQTTLVWNSLPPSVFVFYCSNFPFFLYATDTMPSIVHNSVTTWLSVSFLRFIIP